MTDLLPPGCDRRLRQLHDYWRSIAPGQDELPGRQHFDPLHIPALLPWIWLLDVHRNPLRFRYRVTGTEHRRVSGRDATGRWMDELHPNFTTFESFPEFEAVVERREIRYRRGRPVFALVDDVSETERLMLPLARDGREVDMLLAITIYHRRSGRD
jgi:hypothetical protein